MYDSPARIARDHVDLDGFRPHLADSGRYFSFPSFDTWQPDHPEEEREPQMQMQMQMQSP